MQDLYTGAPGYVPHLQCQDAVLPPSSLHVCSTCLGATPAKGFIANEGAVRTYIPGTRMGHGQTSASQFTVQVYAMWRQLKTVQPFKGHGFEASPQTTYSAVLFVI